ncbi:ribosome modulation factor [Gordonia insulae]|uniref:Uncharacterized protein n=1 Tax=Gordonia insulae TaxID=2420509 RepID=A0A3G8JGM9_9ACTN|nr:hypothetical protein D7316_00168 [Gordonia insulae]
MVTPRERDRRSQLLPTAEAAKPAYLEGLSSRPAAANPYAGKRVLLSMWAFGNHEARRIAWREFQQREAERRRRGFSGRADDENRPSA